MNMYAEKLNLQELVDSYAILSDAKKWHEQAQFFVENGILESHLNEVVHTYKGSEAIEKCFRHFMNGFHTLFHQNGQAVFHLMDATHATGMVYAVTVCVGNNEQGIDILTTSGIVYQDQYEKVDEKWLIVKRQANIMWSKSETYGEGE